LCDFIMSEKVQSLLEHIVTRHLSRDDPENKIPSLEDISSPYVSTLIVLRKAYEEGLKVGSQKAETQSSEGSHTQLDQRHLTGRALEDQRKFEEHDQEECYFESDDVADISSIPSVVDEVVAARESIHHTSRLLSISHDKPLAYHSERVGTPPPGDDTSRGLST